MGLWRQCTCNASGPVAIRYPQVVTHFPFGALEQANLPVEAELHNAIHTKKSPESLEGSNRRSQLKQTYTLKPHEIEPSVSLRSQFPNSRSRIQNLVALRLGARTCRNWLLRIQIGQPRIRSRKPSNSASARSLRELNNRPRSILHQRKKILIRGGGWSPDMLLRQDHEPPGHRIPLRRATWISTPSASKANSKPTNFYNLADQHGILDHGRLVLLRQVGAMEGLEARRLEIATASLRTQIHRMRSHPSMLVWLNGSDNPPPANVETATSKS